MFTIKRLIQLFVFLLLMLGFQIVLILQAQAECEALVTNGFENLSDTCLDMGGNSACTTTVNQIVSVADVDVFNTTMTDETMEVGRMNISANVPLSISDVGLHLLLIGDVTVENAVDPATAFEPSEGATVTTIVGANIRSIPSADGRIVTTAPVGTELVAEGLSSDLQWIYVITAEGSAWISRQIVTTTEGNLDNLPVITNETRTLWQELFLTMSNDNDGCGEDFPPMLYIQSPDDTLAKMIINTIEIRFNSDIVIQIDENNILHLYVIEGSATSDMLSVPAGFTMSIQLSDDGRDRAGAWSNLRPINETERTFLTGLQLIPADDLYRPIEIPSQEEVNDVLSAINQSSAGAGQTVITSVGQGVVDCSGFQPTFPLDAVTPGASPFYWDGATGAEAYNLNFYDVGGALLGSVTVDALNPTYQIDPGDIVGDRGQFAWAVDALVEGQVACSTGKAIVQRVGGAQPVQDSNNDEPAPEPTKCKWNQC